MSLCIYGEQSNVVVFIFVCVCFCCLSQQKYIRNKVGLEDTRSQVDSFTESVENMAEELEDCPNAELLPVLEKATLLLQRAPDEMLMFTMAADTARNQIQRLSKAVSERSKQNKTRK